MTAFATPADVDARLLAWESEAAWSRRLDGDRRRADRNQSPAQRRITEALLSRAHDLRVEAFALTGSTARDQRTAISDLDYHIIGSRPSRSGLADEIDIVATDAEAFLAKLRGGDDYVQWTLRFGCILLDRAGVFRDALRILATEAPWPDTSRKHMRLPAHRAHAERLIEIGDRDAAQEQVRAALTTAARAALLDAGVFPLSRNELPGQLRAIGWTSLAGALRTTIDQSPPLAELASLLDALPGNQRHVVPSPMGGWDVVRPGASRVSSRHRTQHEAVSRAREIVGNGGGGEVVVHARDGRVRERDAIGFGRSSPVAR
jgi:predicted nucleotidyltransferase